MVSLSLSASNLPSGASRGWFLRNWNHFGNNLSTLMRLIFLKSFANLPPAFLIAPHIRHNLHDQQKSTAAGQSIKTPASSPANRRTNRIPSWPSGSPRRDCGWSHYYCSFSPPPIPPTPNQSQRCGCGSQWRVTVCLLFACWLMTFRGRGWSNC